jgi:hypothetical protein
MNDIWEFDSLDITEEEPPVHPLVASAPSGTSDVFMSPSSVASGSTGGKAGAKLGLVFVGEVLDACGGLTSGAGLSGTIMRFCTKPVGLCHTKGHWTKVLLESNTFYIKHTRVGQAHFGPNLVRSFLPEMVEVSDLATKTKQFVEWSAYFFGLKAK